MDVRHSKIVLEGYLAFSEHRRLCPAGELEYAMSRVGILEFGKPIEEHRRYVSFCSFGNV
jgi:hypothetical protein